MSSNDKLSVIIPARNEQFLQKTIECVLAAAVEDIEIIAVCDGYWPEPPVLDHPNVNVLHFTQPVGQRAAINRGARVATGKYFMKLDAHCSLSNGFDAVLKRDCLPEWTMIPRMYNLDITTFQPKYIDDWPAAVKRRKCHDYMFIGWKKGDLRTLYYPSKINAELHKREDIIDDTMSCMGCCWFMHMDRFWEQGGCDEGHGGWGQQGIEVACKAWLSGGALKVNKGAWFAHWYRGGGVPTGFQKGFPYRLTQGDVDKARAYSQSIWLLDKWPKATRSFKWLLDKFDPPTWKKPEENKPPEDKKREFYNHMISGGKMPKWLGTDVIKYPNDLIRYQEVIVENRPDIIIETGTHKGGSALFFASIMDLIGHGEVITIDVKDHDPPKHPRITHHIGRATGADTMEYLRGRTVGKTTMVILDSNHHRSHVKRELSRYQHFVTPGQYMVVEDTNYTEIGKKNGPDEAVDWFMARTKDFAREDLGSKYIYTLNPNSWLKRL